MFEMLNLTLVFTMEEHSNAALLNVSFSCVSLDTDHMKETVKLALRCNLFGMK